MACRRSLLVLLLVAALSGCAAETCNKNLVSTLAPNQTSASLMMEYVKSSVCRVEGSSSPVGEDERKLVLVYDLYVKARSYAMLNKLFFGLSLLFSIAVLLWPAMGVVFKKRFGDQEWYRSTVVQTTITAIAALMIAFYDQYKDKQTYTENLMRYTVYSSQPVEALSRKVIEELGKIDSGFSFGSVADNKEQQ